MNGRLFLAPRWWFAVGLVARAWVASAMAEPASTPLPQALAAPAGNTITLRDAVELALRSHPSQAQARANVETAAARVDESKAAYLPQLATSAQYQRTTGNFSVRPGAFPLGGSNPQSGTDWNPSFNYFTFGATASQLVYDFGQTRQRWRASEANQAAAVQSQHANQVQLVADVRRAYFQARAQKDLVEVAGRALANQRSHLDQVNALAEQGMRPEIDRVTAETNVANAQVQLISAENAYAIACATLDQTIGVGAAAGYQPASDEQAPLPEENASFEQLLAMALRDRPELASFRQQRQAQEDLIKAAVGGYGPSLSAQGNFSAQGQHLDNLTPNWWVGALLSWQLLQGDWFPRKYATPGPR
jgi:outer membrane protein